MGFSWTLFRWIRYVPTVSFFSSSGSWSRVQLPPRFLQPFTWTFRAHHLSVSYHLETWGTRSPWQSSSTLFSWYLLAGSQSCSTRATTNCSRLQTTQISCRCLPACFSYVLELAHPEIVLYRVPFASSSGPCLRQTKYSACEPLLITCHLLYGAVNRQVFHVQHPSRQTIAKSWDFVCISWRPRFPRTLIAVASNPYSCNCAIC